MQPAKRKSPRKFTVQETIQVYTDWANHYLEKGASKRRIQDLQRDVTDGVLLADVIEAATSQKIPDINRKPKSSAQMTDNIRVSLSFLGALGVTVDGLHAKDVRDGNLKSILGLFYALSRFKQQQKQMPRLPSPFHRAAGGGVVTGIPTPKRLGGTGTAGSAGSSRSTSPLTGAPQPNNVGTVPPRPARSPYGVAASDSRTTYIPATPDSRGSMLDKLKLFQRPDKTKTGVVSGSKRTSSSSGVSSARSERSDSSTSLCGEPNRQPTSVEKEVPVAPNSSSPKSLARGLRNRLKGAPSSSPKRSSPKVGRKTDVTPKIPQKPADVSDVQSGPRAVKREETGAGDGSSLDPSIPRQMAGPKRDGDSTVEYASAYDSHNGVKQSRIANFKREVDASSTDRRSVEYTSPVDAQTGPKHNKFGTFRRDVDSTSRDRSSVEYTSPVDSRAEMTSFKPDELDTTTNRGSVEYASPVDGSKEVPSPAPQDGPKIIKPDGSGIPKPMATVRGTTKVALVAPMPTDTMSESSHSNSTGQSNSSEGSVIYRPSSESGSEVPSKEDCVRPMEPLLRGYNRPLMMRVTSRPIKPCHNLAMTQGYLSDGETRRVNMDSDSGDGYISEGGASLLARKIINSLDCEGGLYSRGRGDEGVPSGGPGSHGKRLVRVGASSPSQSRSTHNQPQVVYRVVSSRVKKADSSQQTDNSSFRASQSSQWRKYTDVARVPEQHAHKYSEAREKYDVTREKYGDFNRIPDLGREKYGGLGRGGEKYGDPSREKFVDVPDSSLDKYGDVNRMPELTRGKSDLEVGRSKSRSTGSHGRRLEKNQSEKSSSHRKQGMRDDSYCNGLNGDCGKQSKVRGVPHSFGYVKRGSPSAAGGCKGEPRTAQVSAVPRTKVKVSGGTQTCSDLHHYKSYSLTGPSASQLSQSVRERLLLGSLSLPHWRSRQDGSLSDSSWRVRQTDGSLSDCTYADLHEAESLESLSSLPAMLQHRASLTHARLALHSRDSPRLNRSNSIRSTKSEKLYPSMLERGDEEPYYCLSSGPTSPTLLGGSASSYALGRHKSAPPEKPARDDDAHGSSLSLVSTASSLYSTPEEKQAHEIRKLRRELQDAHEKVHTLSSQLSTNAHVVSAFEQSLSNMTQRLQQLTASAELKDSELQELRQTVDLLRQQGSSSLPRRHTINTSEPSGELSRQLSADSVSSLSSACSGSSSHRAGKKKKKGWLRSSFGRAFSRSKRNKHGSVSDVEDFRESSAPGSPTEPPGLTTLKTSVSSSALYAQGDEVDQLRKQLREKDLVLTDIRLEALSSAHQLESLKDTVIKMRDEMLDLKRDNERLQRLLGDRQSASVRRFSTDRPTALCGEEREVGGQRRLTVAAHLDGGGDCVVGAILVGEETSWDSLDASVTQVFKDYLHQVDPGCGLGLGTPFGYQLGRVTRRLEASSPDGQVDPPDPLPWECLEGDSPSALVSLKGAEQDSVDALAFDTLIPKSIMHRYVSLLVEHRRIILCGPSGTGKTHLARRLAEHLVSRDGSSPDSVATFNVDHQSGKELRQYLSHIADQCEADAADLPSVIVLDNLHHAASLGEVFNGFLSAKYAKCPYIIGTMNQATCSTTNLQLHHNFRWVLCANHMEPVKGFLGRYLRRRLIASQVCNPDSGPSLARVMDWVPSVWQHLNRFLETHSSSDVTVGPRLFLNCPADCADSQVWFADLWNYSLVPYLLEAVREGLQLYGRRAAWEDPASYVLQTYPWAEAGPSLLRLRPEDVGYGQGAGSSSVKSLSSAHSDTEGDPLLNMLMRLQEAANYSSPPSNDSDSVESHSTDKEGRVESTL